MSELKRAIAWDKTAGNTPSHKQDLNDPFVKLSINLVQEEVNGENELLDSYNKNDLKGVIDGIGDSLKVITQLAFSLALDPEEILHEVNNSNFSKFCLTKEDADLSVESYKNDQRYINVHHQLVNNMFVLYGWKNGQDPRFDKPKVLKGIHYVEPDIEQFIK